METQIWESRTKVARMNEDERQQVMPSQTMEFKGRGWGWFFYLLMVSPFILLFAHGNPNPSAEELKMSFLFPFFYPVYWRFAYDVLPKRVVLTNEGVEYYLWKRKQFEAKWKHLSEIRCVHIASESLADHSLPTSFMSFNRLVIRTKRGPFPGRLVLTNTNHFSTKKLRELFQALVKVKERYGLDIKIEDRTEGSTTKGGVFSQTPDGRVSQKAGSFRRSRMRS